MGAGNFPEPYSVWLRCFFDFSGLASGDFESVILENIHGRAHFLVLLTPSALERCDDPADWLRREIQAALDSKRNIVPLMLEGFDFGTPAIASQLTGKLALLKQYNAVGIPPDFPAMERLRDKLLNVVAGEVLHPASPSARQAATEQKGAAAMAPPVAEGELAAQQWFERGLNAQFNGDLGTAIECYGEAVQLKPDYTDALTKRGHTRLIKGDFGGALADLSEANRLRPDHLETIVDRCIARGHLSDLEGVRADFSEAIRLKRNYSTALKNRDIVRKAKAGRSKT